MYESPIDVIYGKIQLQLERNVCKAVQQVDIKVDKEELIKALNYDRCQYEKGRNDALWEIGRFCEWVPCEKRLPEVKGEYLVTMSDAISGCYATVLGYSKEDGWHYDDGEHFNSFDESVIAWMPLPKPYKEGREINEPER